MYNHQRRSVASLRRSSSKSYQMCNRKQRYISLRVTSFIVLTKRLWTLPLGRLVSIIREESKPGMQNCEAELHFHVVSAMISSLSLLTQQTGLYKAYPFQNFMVQKIDISPRQQLSTIQQFQSPGKMNLASRTILVLALQIRLAFFYSPYFSLPLVTWQTNRQLFSVVSHMLVILRFFIFYLTPQPELIVDTKIGFPSFWPTQYTQNYSRSFCVFFHHPIFEVLLSLEMQNSQLNWSVDQNRSRRVTSLISQEQQDRMSRWSPVEPFSCMQKILVLWKT